MHVGSKYWRVPRLWDGQTAAILAGGPSLTQRDVDAVKRAVHVRCITVNDSYRLAPWADLAYFCDLRWWSWHHERPAWRDLLARAAAGETIVATLENLELLERHPFIRCLRNVGRDGIETTPGAIKNGGNGGYQALNIAVQLGARRVLLLGFDMRRVANRSHWHDGHPVVAPETVYRDLMIPSYTNAAPELARLGVEVVNCTPGSALTAFPFQSIDEALRHETSTAADPPAAELSA